MPTSSVPPTSIGVVGLGMTGLPLAGAFRDAGRRVLGFEADAARRAAVEAGDGEALGVPAERWFGPPAIGVTGAAPSSPNSPGRGSFDVATDLERVGQCEALFLCLPTPLDADGAPDLSAIKSAAQQIAPHLAEGALVVLCSTTWPGTTEQKLVPWLHAAGPRRLGRDLCVAYSPEREDPGSGRRTRDVPRLVGGMDAASLERARALLAEALDTVHPVESCATAEAAKLLENVFRAVNIALVNEFKQVLDAQGIDVWPVVRAAATKPYGFMPFEPGPGLGGHCIPVDPEYLTWAARRAGVPAPLVELALDVNRDLPRRVVSKLSEALDARGSQLEGARVLVLGAAYKPGVADTRESPGLRIMELCEGAGARTDFADPFVPRLDGDVPHVLAGRESVDLETADIAAYNAVILAVHHPDVDLASVAESARLIVDTRDAFRGFDLPPERLVRA